MKAHRIPLPGKFIAAALMVAFALVLLAPSEAPAGPAPGRSEAKGSRDSVVDKTDFPAIDMMLFVHRADLRRPSPIERERRAARL